MTRKKRGKWENRKDDGNVKKHRERTCKIHSILNGKEAVWESKKISKGEGIAFMWSSLFEVCLYSWRVLPLSSHWL